MDNDEWHRGVGSGLRQAIAVIEEHPELSRPALVRILVAMVCDLPTAVRLGDADSH